MSAQSAVTLLHRVRPGELAGLSELLDGLGAHVGRDEGLRLVSLPGLHFASLSLLPDVAGAPGLLFEACVDGDPDAFLRRLVEHAGPPLRQVYAHCEGDEGASSGLVGRLRAGDIGAAVFFVAWPGRSVEEVRAEDELRRRLQDHLYAPEQAGLRSRPPDEVHRAARSWVGRQPDLRWALTPARVPFLVGHGPALLGVLKGTGLVLAAALVHGARRSRAARAALAALVAGVGAAGTGLWAAERADRRRDEGRDWQAVYARWSRNLPDVRLREDLKGQNHLVSVVRVKDGVLRPLVLRTVLAVVAAGTRLTANRGKLGGISTIHFARWSLTPDRRQLIFLSNFDGSWESYLNDFIDLAARGLTAIWTNTDNAVGFPDTRWLLGEGARDEARFKAYARYEAVSSGVWYSAYPDLSVATIGNNSALRAGLARPLDADEAQTWLRRL